MIWAKQCFQDFLIRCIIITHVKSFPKSVPKFDEILFYEIYPRKLNKLRKLAKVLIVMRSYITFFWSPHPHTYIDKHTYILLFTVKKYWKKNFLPNLTPPKTPWFQDLISSVCRGRKYKRGLIPSEPWSA